MFNNIIILLSGKRKSGKDYIAEKLLDMIGKDKCTIIRISEPIKSHYAKVNNLDLVELMSANKYKEEHRKQMIIWSDQMRNQDPSYFCRAACSEIAPKPIWIVSDIRRKTDIAWFKTTYGDQIRTVRMFATEQARVSRGFTFTVGVDDVSSECDLDDFTEWDLCISNNNKEECDDAIQKILSLANIA